MYVLHQSLDILKKPNSIDDPKPIQYARDMYAACLNTGITADLRIMMLTNYSANFKKWKLYRRDRSFGSAAFDTFVRRVWTVADDTV